MRAFPRIRTIIALAVGTVVVSASVQVGTAAAANAESNVKVVCFANSNISRGAHINDTVAWASAAPGQTLTVHTSDCTWFYFDSAALQPTQQLTDADPDNTDEPWAYLVPESGTLTFHVIAKPTTADPAVLLYPLPFADDDGSFKGSSAVMWAKPSKAWPSSVVTGASSRHPLVMSTHWTDASTKKSPVTGYRVGIRTILRYTATGEIWSKTKWTTLGPNQFTMVWNPNTAPKPGRNVCADAWDMQVVPLTKTGALPASPWRGYAPQVGC